LHLNHLLPLKPFKSYGVVANVILGHSSPNWTLILDCFGIGSRGLNFGLGLNNFLNIRVLVDRALFSPVFLTLTLYLLSRLQGENHQVALDITNEKFLNSLFANWKIWTVPQIININLVPVQYRVLFANLVALVWNFYLSTSKKSVKTG